MLLNLLAGLPVILSCLVLQAVFVAKCLRYYGRYRMVHAAQRSQWRDILLLSSVMLLTLLGNFVQMAIWAALFMLIGEFDDFASALYHSAVITAVETPNIRMPFAASRGPSSRQRADMTTSP